ncbi:Calcium-dependent channel, 7TM region, putative phosphate, partial [Teratosphaeria destructans]
MSSPAEPSAACKLDTPSDWLNCNSGLAANSEGQSINNLLAAIAGSFAAFGLQLLLFLLLRLKLKRIYRPRSFLVPQRDRVAPPPPGLVAWLAPLFTTTNLTLIQKCGLDAYFFLRYLRMLLKIFFPTGLDQLNISNVGPRYVAHRLWAHLILAVLTVAWIAYVAYTELRGYIRVRQAFLTSPQHRIRASATTVLVTGVPRKWLTYEALAGLYDVFPGGIKNIWINRNFDALADKVKYRDAVAQDLESAETNLIRRCVEKHEERRKKQEKELGVKKSKEERKQDAAAGDAAAQQTALGAGVTAGDQHDTPRVLGDRLKEAQAEEDLARAKAGRRRAANLGLFGQGLDRVGLGMVNTGLGQGLGAVGYGLGAVGKGVGGLGHKVAGGVDQGLHRLDETVNAADAGNNFVTDEGAYRRSERAPREGPLAPGKQDPDLPQLDGIHIPAGTFSGEMIAAGAAGSSSPGYAGARVAPAQTPPYMRHPLGRQSSFLSQRSRPGGQTDSPASDRTLGPTETRPSGDSKPKSSMHVEEPEHRAADHHSWWKVWRNHDHSLALPSPQPHTADDDEFPLHTTAVKVKADSPGAPKDDKEVSSSKWVEKLAFWRSGPKEEYPRAFNPDVDEDQDGEPKWREYIEPKDRETMRLPLFSDRQGWCPSIPFVGKKVDSIYFLRRELARLNLEIEIDQAQPDKFPFMNSAFVQFNHQVAAHMACQSLSHHVPQQMAPRIIEISPEDVLWDNMAIKWWEKYLRSVLVLSICVMLIILYAIPVTFSSLLYNLNSLAAKWSAFAWVARIPRTVQSILQGILPALILNIILAIMPLVFRLLVKFQGVPTGAAVQLGVQAWYFAFLWIQVFLVVTISSGLTEFFTQLADNPGQVIKSLATSLPGASDYFFSYLLIQALGNSASALVQVMSLVGWFIFAPLFDSTARAKWRRETTLQNVQWGSFYPAFTNFAVIGIIYSVIAPFILVFMLIIYGVFWIVYRYNVLYVYQFRFDTGGLLFPVAVNQLFTGVYFLELCLIGYFFISTGPDGDVACIPQGAIMIVVAVLTAAYQWQLNATFRPLLRYLPITLDDEAVIRDEAFARAQEGRFTPLVGGEDQQEEEEERRDEHAAPAADAGALDEKTVAAARPGEAPDASVKPRPSQRIRHLARAPEDAM